MLTIFKLRAKHVLKYAALKMSIEMNNLNCSFIQIVLLTKPQVQSR